MKYWDRKKIDLTGQKFGRLTVLEEALPDKHGNTKWRCICDCGSITDVYGTKLRNGETVSCGCKRKGQNVKHGLEGTHIYSTWYNMKSLCYNDKNPKNKAYRGKGIEVCDEWKDDILTFAKWSVENGYEPDKKLLRYDTDKGFYPWNCRWGEANQAQGRRSKKIFTFNGETHSLAEWSRITGIHRDTIECRMLAGKAPEEILKK
ncbi:MAG: AP2 domain-containing protein [Oscillospiraceae bacterium]|nr:AP2 domain-containing protein [Oscillospiraceae bacterium]